MQSVRKTEIAKHLLVLGKQATALTAVFAAIIPFALMLSLIHEIAFYSTFNFGFLALLEATDYLKQAIYWIPILSLCYIGGVGIGLRKGKTYNEEYTQAIASGDPSELIKLGSKENMFSISVLSILFILMVILTVLNPWPILFLTLPLSVLFFVTEKIHRWAQPPHRWIYELLLPFSVMSLFSAALGYAESYSKLISGGSAPGTRVSTRLAPTGLDVTVLRYIDKGLLCIVKSDHSVIFLPWSDVEKVETKLQITGSILDIITSTRK